MPDFNDLSSYLQPVTNQVDLLHTMLNFGVCIIMSFVLRKFYINRSFSLSGKHHIGSILPILSAIVFLVIIIVKTSLALSLGLVGALSIVRFRTPIKEPEELVYLFLAIALGLGYGAGHLLLTTVLSTLTLLMIFFWLSSSKLSGGGEYNLIIDWPDADTSLESLSEPVKNLMESMKLIRLETGESGNTAVLLVELGKKNNLDQLVGELKRHHPKINITFFEAKANW